MLPLKLVLFWYPESWVIFLRTYKNLIRYLEEDLAVGLMFKLLFVPLFHDSSLLGQVLSFLFRLVRILVGVWAIILTTLVIGVMALVWWAIPILAVTGPRSELWQLLLFAGMTLFVSHLLSHPPKKLSQIKNVQKIWQCSLVNKKDNNLKNLLKKYEVAELLKYLEQVPATFASLSDPVDEAPVLAKTLELGKKTSPDYLGPEHFFVARLSLVQDIDKYLMQLGLKVDDFVSVASFLGKRRKQWRMVWLWDDDFRVKHLRGVNRGWLGVVTPTLDKFGEDFTSEAAKGNAAEFMGRRKVVDEVISILSLEKGTNVLLVGQPGSGKTTLIKSLAKMIISGDSPPAISTKRLFRLDITKLLSGISGEGELAERLKGIFEEVEFSGNILVFIDEIHNLGLGEAGASFNLFSLLLSYLESNKFQFIAATEPENYHRVVEKNSVFAGLFTKIEVGVASLEETVEVLQIKAIDSERYKKIKTSVLALAEMANLSARYIKDRVLPDSALAIFEECLAKAQDGWVKKVTVEQVVENRAGVPVVATQDSQNKKKLLNLEDLIHQRLIDQEEAVKAVADALRRASVELRDQKKPIGSFLFVGPTGVGKTELAKTLAEVYFSHQGSFVRFDMSEYQGPEAIERLIGNFQEEGSLIEAMEVNPYALILFDEFEKADLKILTLFLQVLDDGRLTSATGKTVDFTNSIIITTSNAASLTIAKGLGEGLTLEQLDKQVNDELLQIFRPELINRFDEVVLFKPLSSEDLQKIVKLKLAQVQNQLQEQGYVVEFDEPMVLELAKQGFDPVLGARPLNRLIQDKIESKLSVMILEGKLPKGQTISLGQDFLT